MTRAGRPLARNAPRAGETIAEAVARFVRMEIFDGRLVDGQRLPQDEVAAAVGVSRIPVREAIIVLEREGWVRSERHRGAFVNALDDRAVIDRFALYGRFYGFAARRALQRMQPGDLEALGRLAAELGRLDDPHAFERVNNLYMSRLVQLAGSARLRGVLRSTAQIVPGNFFATVPNSVAIQQIGISELQAALEAGDTDATERICAAMEHRHALEVIEVLSARRCDPRFGGSRPATAARPGPARRT